MKRLRWTLIFAVVGTALVVAWRWSHTERPTPPTPVPVEPAPPTPAPAVEPAPPSSAHEPREPVPRALALLLAQYADVADLTASFTQNYRFSRRTPRVVGSGRVWLTSSGLMRWDYTTPEHRVIVFDGSDLYDYWPADRVVRVRRGHRPDMPSLRFLIGRATLQDDFAARESAPGVDGLIVDLIPRSLRRDLSKVRLTLDEKTGRIIESATTEPSGNTNAFRFTDIRTNTGLTQERFRFELPAGVSVVEEPASPW